MRESLVSLVLLFVGPVVASAQERPDPPAPAAADDATIPGIPSGAPTEEAGAALSAPGTTIAENVLSVHLLGLVSGGFALQYERLLGPRKLSLTTTVGTRLPASGDYGSIHLGVGAGLRWWAVNDPGVADERTAGGFFAAGRLDLAWTHVWDRAQDRAVGDTVTVTPAIELGWRFVVATRLEITPTVGLGLRTEIDPSGSLPAQARGTFLLGLTAGWLF